MSNVLPRLRRLALVTAVLSAALTPAAAQITYEFVNGFSGTSNTATDTWQYFNSVDVNNRNGSYTRFTYFDSAWNSTNGLGLWAASDNNVDTSGLVGVNNSGSTQFGVANGYGFLHPASGVMSHGLAVAVGFRAPATATYSVSGSMSVNQPGGSGISDGIRWYLDQGSTGLLSGSVPWGGSDTFSQSNISLNAGDMLFFILDKNSHYNYDSTQFSMTVTSSIPEPSTYAAFAGIAVLGVAMWRRRQRAH